MLQLGQLAADVLLVRAVHRVPRAADELRTSTVASSRTRSLQGNYVKLAHLLASDLRKRAIKV
jgi:hypothetical protein